MRDVSDGHSRHLCVWGGAVTGKHSVVPGPDPITVELANIYNMRAVANYQLSMVPISDDRALERVRALKCQLTRLIKLENTALKKLKRQEAQAPRPEPARLIRSGG